MTQTGDGAQPRSKPVFHLTHWKCINWHNLVEQDWPIRGRNVFNLGANESGKTTWLDSVHAVLTLGHEMEWNSAADPVASKQQLREHGRKLGGVVHRVNDDLVLHAAPGIAYFAIELSTADRTEVLTIGIGVYSSRLEAKPDVWGFIMPRRLAEVEFLDATTGNVRDQSQLEAAYGVDEVFNPIQYRRRLSERLYGSTTNYNQILELLNLGKSYSRLSRESPRFTRLFRQCLPPVDREQIQRARTELKDLKSLEDNVEGTNAKLRVLQGLQAEVETVRRETSKLARYAYKRELNAYEDAQTRLDALGKKAREAADAADAQKKVLDGLTAKLEAEQGIVGELRGTGSVALVEQLQTVTQDFEREKRRHTAALQRTEEAAGAERDAKLQFEGAWSKAEQAVERLASQLEALAASLPREAATAADLLQSALAPMRAVSPTDAEPPKGLLAPLQAGLAELDGLAAQERHRKAAAADQLERLEPQIQDITQRIQQLDARQEPDPPVTGLDEAIADIREDVLVVYRSLETTQRLGDAALLEAFLPKHVLGAIIPRKPALVEKVKRHVHAKAPHLRVVDTRDLVEPRPDLSESILASIDSPASDSLALAYLASQYGSVRLLGPGIDRGSHPRVVWSDGTVYDGKTWHLEGVREAPELLGAEARRRAYLAARARLEAEKERLEQQAGALRKQAEEADDLLQQFEAAKGGVEAAAKRHPVPDLLYGAFLKRVSWGARSKETKREADAARELEPIVEGWLRRVQVIQEQVDAKGANTIVDRLREAVDALGILDGKQRAADREHARLGEAARSAHAEVTKVEPQMEPLRTAIAAARVRVAAREGIDESELDRYLDARGFRTMQNLDKLEGDARREAAGAHARIDTTILNNTHRANLRYDPDQELVVEPHTNRTLDALVDQLNVELSATRAKLVDEFRRVSQQLFVGQIAARLKQAVLDMKQRIKRINQELAAHEFRTTTYFIEYKEANAARAGSVDEANQVRPIAQMHELVLAAHAEESQDELARFMIDALKASTDEVPAAFDYRNWYEFELRKTKGPLGPNGGESEENNATGSAIRTGGSGGGQAIPRYLFCFCLFAAVYAQAHARLRLVLLDEAFQRVDPGNVNQLLEFARSQELDLIVTNPDLDANDVTEDATTQLFRKNDELETFIESFSREPNTPKEATPDASLP